MSVPTWGCEEVDVERGFLWRVTVSGPESLRPRVRLILLRPPRISQGNEVAAPAVWHGAKHLDSARDSVPWKWALSWEIESWEKECFPAHRSQSSLSSESEGGESAIIGVDMGYDRWKSHQSM